MSKITNKLNLPKSFINYADSSNVHTYEPNTYSVTELLSGTREIVLRRRHRDEITTDICDMIPALFGTAVHKVLEENGDSNCQQEVQMSTTFGKYILFGICDVLNVEEELIEDYKTCSVSKVMKKDFDDWRKQGLSYAYIQLTKGIIVRHLKFYALMKDWSKIKSLSVSNYPSSPIYIWEMDIQDSDFDYIQGWLKQKFADIEKAESELPECSNEERWYTGDTFAVLKTNKDLRATKVFASEQEAQDFVQNKMNGVGIIQKREGENLKCLYYCDCSKFCQKGV